MLRPRGPVAWIRDLCFGVAIVTVAILVARLVAVAPDSAAFVPPALGLLSFLFALLVYLAGHLARIARVALIAADTRLSLRRLVNVHFFTAAVGLALPFKLGDAYRALELSGLVGGLTRGIVIVCIERVFDVALILIMITVALAFGSALSPDLAPVLLASTLFVAIAAAGLLLLPDNLRRIGSYVMRRYDRPWTVGALRGIANARAAIGGVSQMLKGRYSSLLLLTIAIWACEVLSLALVLRSIGVDGGPVDALLRFLSSITEGATLLGRIGPGAWSWNSPLTLPYLAATQFPLALVGGVAGVMLLASRRGAFAAALKPAR